MTSNEKGRAQGTDRVVHARDGRKLGLFLVGPEDGTPVFFFHGAPGSRLLPPEAVAAGEKYRLRYVGIDRPGFGLSDFQKGRKLLDWPADVAAIADALGIQRFSVLAVSSGGPYALACCYALPERVSRAAIVGGLAPGRYPALISDTSGLPRPIVLGMRRFKLVAKVLYSLLGIGIKRDPERARQQLSLGLSAADQKILSRRDVTDFILGSTLEGLRAGARGLVEDDHLMVHPWGFAPSDIRGVPIHLWYGDDDLAVPLADAQKLASDIPSAEMHLLKGEGHMLIFDHLDGVMGSLSQATGVRA